MPDSAEPDHRLIEAGAAVVRLFARQGGARLYGLIAYPYPGGAVGAVRVLWGPRGGPLRVGALRCELPASAETAAALLAVPPFEAADPYLPLPSPDPDFDPATPSGLARVARILAAGAPGAPKEEVAWEAPADPAAPAAAGPDEPRSPA
jgi:hypothetical protein